MFRESAVVVAWAVGALAGASYPAKPSDLSTPFQQRIAIKGPGGKSILFRASRRQVEAD